MNMMVASLVFVCLLTIALATMLWSLGRTWPIRNKLLLAQAVIGRPGATRVKKRWAFLTMLVALGLGILALSLADKVAGGPGLTFAGLVLGALLIARGVAGYAAPWRRLFPEEPFATLDRKTYSPLALGLGIGFLLLVLMRLL
jgi:hypothetical protein